MYCPSCGAEQPPGPVCLACGRSFRRQPELPRGPRQVRRYQRRGVSGRVLGCSTTLVVGLVVVLAAIAFLTREPVRAPVEDEGARSSVAAVPSPAVPIGQGTSPVAGNRRVTVTEGELDRWLAEYAAELRPASDPQAEIDADGIALHVRIYGLGATYRARPVVRDGRLVLEDGRIEGPLGLGMGAESVTARLQAALDERLAGAGLRPVAVELRPGALTVEFEPVEG
ncbi:hypothetical protein [Thermomicrobium sp.]